LLGRKVEIAVLDLDEQGPAFGTRAIEALCAPAAPLSDLDIGFRHFHHDWSNASFLHDILDQLRASEAICAISSEGGLFEYGSETEILSSLKTLHAGTAADAFFVGSVTREGEPVRATQTANRIATRPRTIEAFQSLAQEAGWSVHATVERPFSYHVHLMKM
jgi:hypothetical protein